QAACLGAMLKSEDIVARKKAAYELSRLPAAAAGPVIAKNLASADLPTREILTFAAYRAPSPEIVAAIDQTLKDEASKGKSHALDHYRLKLLRAWLKNSADAVAQK